ncbi:alpha/beta fold hydrolase [Enterobacter hormaechei]|uniref:alpha/beta fold hydrolase n=1 Tax=Enterobacter hormaechei TaxID=158836 RepID=UPI0021761965|nr:alpha/beta hydrolase [Enterobacter hormaechei]UVZ93279.1 alpha/beta hydrolase [Enterobacter hormaechei]
MTNNFSNKHTMNPEEKWFTSTLDNASIFYRVWRPNKNIKVQSIIQLTHGICEHSNRYDEFAKEMNKHGHVVFGIDLRGHGKTGVAANQLGNAPIDFWFRMLKDINQLTMIIKNEYLNIPIIAFGHSMGSVLTQSTIQNNGLSFDAAILCGTLGSLPGGLDITMQELKQLAITHPAKTSVPFKNAMNNLNSMLNTTAAEQGDQWMTTSVEEISKFLKDQLSGRPFTNAMMYSVFEGFISTWKKKHEEKIPKELPILICAGSADPISYNGRTCRNLIKRYINNDIAHLTYNFYSNDRHEVWNGEYKHTFFKDVHMFIGCVLSKKK